MAKLDKITLRGFKSIEKLEDFPLGDLNVVIGANGVGKSNFVDFFRVLRAMVEERLQLYVGRNGPADGYFYNGVAFTRRIEADLGFGNNRYVFSLEPTAGGKIILAQEQTQYFAESGLQTISRGEWESALPRRKDDTVGYGPWPSPNLSLWSSISSWQVYHFHDTSMTSGMRRDVGVEQTAVLQPDGSNLAAFLLGLRDLHRERYELVRKTLQRIAPYFDDFELRVTKAAPQDMVRLTWRRKGSDYIFSPGHLSDGTIRFLCVATVLLQPSPPTTIVLDAPELGLHPEALSVLGGLIRSASTRMQLVLATQSPTLLSEFEPDQIITVDQVDGATRFNRLDPAALADWLDEFTVGELWQKGTIRGGVNNA
jgi:predicted ATPase